MSNSTKAYRNQIYKSYLNNIADALKAGTATEHTHRPALKSWLELMDLEILATNEPKQIACGAPDYIITRSGLTIGYIEAKDVGKPLETVENSEQLKRYRKALDNLILTDYLEFRWYAGGELREEGRLARVQSNGKLKAVKGGQQAVESLLQNFLWHQVESVSTPKELAERMARLTHIIRDIIITTFETGQASTLLQAWRKAFADVLIADLGQPERTADFADMVAQTLAYGLFSARLMAKTPTAFSRSEARRLIPKSNPFLRRFFSKMTGIELDDEPFAPFVNDLVTLLAHTDMEAVLADFGKRTRQDDPIVHFYETFLAAYDPKLREARGVYYTPTPVVSYIVRSVDALLKSHFNCPDGLADSQKIPYAIGADEEGDHPADIHKVLVLDPAAGTGTFLYAVIDLIREQFMRQGNAGMWAGYVKNHLLPRLFGFELLMAPYAVAHFKLSLQLAGRDLHESIADQWAYTPDGDDRLGVYLTNALEGVHEMNGLSLFTQWVADETNAANKVKRKLPVLVVMGNPPYSGHSANKGKWIDNLLKGKLADGGKTSNYYEVDGKPLGERNPKWLQDDYVKFIRFGQWRIEESGQGILAFISNHAYLDNPTFRGMRQSLMQTFNEIYILDLHGNVNKREISPDGSKDKNVFDIMQGVAITIFVKTLHESGLANIYHADLWGTRANKYAQLFEQDVTATMWNQLKPQSPFYLFVPQNMELLSEYNQGWKINDVFPVNSVGIVTGQDKNSVGFDRAETNTLAQEFELFNNVVTPITYRVFDERFVVYHSKAITRNRYEVMRHVINKKNVGLIFMRQVALHNGYSHFGVSRALVDNRAFYSNKGITSYAPLYLYKNGDKQKILFDASIWMPDEANGGRIPNVDPAFVKKMEQQLGLTFQPAQELTGLQNLSTLDSTFTPEDIFHYIYAIFHSPTYRQRYAEFLKIDFPRVPLTSNVTLFRDLCVLGQQLVSLHLLESPAVRQSFTRYPIAGDNIIAKGYPKYVPPLKGQEGRVHINKTQYVEGIAPALWAFRIGGYQVLHKWLKDRRGRPLSFNELVHYQQTAVALQETMRLMTQIDDTIIEWPIA